MESADASRRLAERRTRRRARSRPAKRRRGSVIVEAAFVLPIILSLMLGVWEVGRMIQVSQIMENAAREGARVAAGGYVNGTAVTVSTVQTAVQNYLSAAGLPSAAATGAQVSVNCLATLSWTDPYLAQPLDPFKVTVTIPAGAPFDSLRWNLLNKITSANQLSASVYWQSANNSQVTVSTTLPY
jgi:Flp pilus assembly protein TadG